MSAYTVTCPACGTLNRVPGDREGVKGRCGSCRAELPALYRQPQQLNDHTFDQFLKSYPGPVLAEFWAPW